MKRPWTAALLFVAAQLTAGCAHAGRLADLSLYDRTTGQTLPLHWHDGCAWVEGRPGNEYRVSVRNNTGGDVLTVLSVDGVNAISGETASPAQSGYVLGAWESVEVDGWRKSLEHTAAFYFTRLPDSYAARTGRPDNVGVIGVALFRRKPAPPVGISEKSLAQREAPAPSQDAAPAAAASGAAQDAKARNRAEQPSAEPPLGTGHGRSEISRARRVEFERATTQPEELLTIYYDSRANLIARGVLPAEPAKWRAPQAFPTAFVPDPPRW